MDALKAAYANGADAVYLGAAAFGARASAGFDPDTLKSAMHLAHLHGKKIYVTVNILVKDQELDDVRKTLSLLRDLHADGVILQDLGLMKICREEFPSLPVHASTQMALHNGYGAEFVKKLGAKRIVLARECTLSDMRRAADTGLEVEAFCHGAMCVSVSGQCLFSSMIGGRSGNRGRCAQPCRLNYTYQGKEGAWLSPRDLCARDHMLDMCLAGVHSFKIEGRLKRPEYVAEVTSIYRKALDQVLSGSFSFATDEENERLRQIFSRGGFIKGYLAGAEDAGIIYEKRVTPEGLVLGNVKNVYKKGGVLLADVALQRDLHNEDGLEAGKQPLRYAGPDVQNGKTATLRLRDALKPGDTVRITDDESQLSRARATYEGTAFDAALPIPFDAYLYAMPGQPVSAFFSDGVHAAHVGGEICQKSENKPLTEEAVRRSFEKTGGTPFVLRDLHTETQNAFFPFSLLNALRREGLEKLALERIENHSVEESEKACFAPSERWNLRRRLIVSTPHFSDLEKMLENGADAVIFAPEDYTEKALSPLLSCFPKDAYLALPVQCSDETLSFLHRITQEYRIPVVLSSPGQMGLVWHRAICGEGIPVMNTETVNLLSHLGYSSCTFSREMKGEQIRRMSAAPAECILPVYGRTRLMVLNHCPMRTLKGMKANRHLCTLCERGCGTKGTFLTDRMGVSYPLVPIHLKETCLVQLYAAAPLNLSEKLQGHKDVSWLVHFTTENEEERQHILRHFAALRKGETPSPLRKKGVLGRYTDGVL